MSIGPYDLWAIEYGYKPIAASDPRGELEDLGKIAARSGERELAFLTDEDTYGIHAPDPAANVWDLGDDPVAYARRQAAIAKQCIPSVVDRVVKKGDGYQKALRSFEMLVRSYDMSLYYVSRSIGGLHMTRSHKGDAGASAPLTVVPAERQREALALLAEHVFSDKPFQFPPELYNQLVPSFWDHWGTYRRRRFDYPVHELIGDLQTEYLTILLSTETLQRVHDSELKIPSDQDAFTVAELFDGLTKAIYAELDTLKKDGKFTPRQPAVSSLRRNLQRAYLRELGRLALGKTSMFQPKPPEDCQTLAYGQLKQLQKQLEKVLESDTQLDAYSQAHWDESLQRIKKILDAHIAQTGV